MRLPLATLALSLERAEVVALSRKDVSPERLRLLAQGEAETKNLVEGLAFDLSALWVKVHPEISLPDWEKEGYVGKLRIGGRVLAEQSSLAIENSAKHPSDTVRGWACFAWSSLPNLSFEQRLSLIRPLAADHHFGVREWAWLALRPHLDAELDAALSHLSDWVREPDANLRRFASEISRPRGVWCRHIQELKDNPDLGLPILEPLKSDPAEYVQLSVANWLNDAGKSQPEWLSDLTGRWLVESPTAETRAIVKRGLRSLSKAPS